MLRGRVQDLGLVRHRGNPDSEAASHGGANPGRPGPCGSVGGPSDVGGGCRGPARLRRVPADMTMPPPEGGGIVIGIAAWRRVHDAAFLARLLGIRLLVGFLNFSLNTAAAVYRIPVIAGPLPDLGGVLIPAGCNLGARCAAA